MLEAVMTGIEANLLLLRVAQGPAQLGCACAEGRVRVVSTEESGYAVAVGVLDDWQKLIIEVQLHHVLQLPPLQSWQQMYCLMSVHCTAS